MKLKRVISLTVAAAILALSLTSCAKTPESLIEKADKALSKKAHVIEVGVDYTVDNETISSIFDQLERREVKLLVDGDKTAIEDRMSISYSGGETEFVNNYVVIGGALYMDMRYTSTEGSNSTKGRSKISDEDALSFKEKASIIGGISIDDFAEVTVEKVDGEHLIICSSLLAESEVDTKLDRMMYSQLEGSASTVGVSDIVLKIYIDNGKYEKVILECEYYLNFGGGAAYTVTAEFELEYDYDERVNITAPANPSEYSDMELETILGTL